MPPRKSPASAQLPVGGGEMVPDQRPISAQSQGTSNQQREHEPTLPPASEAANTARRKVIDIAEAVASRASMPVLDIVKRRMYLAWLRGVDISALRVVYGVRSKPVEHTLREIAKEREEQMRIRRNAA